MLQARCSAVSHLEEEHIRYLCATLPCRVLAAATDAVVSPEGTLLSAARMHVVLDAAQLGPSGRVIIVGDVHGCCDELEVSADLSSVTLS